MKRKKERTGENGPHFDHNAPYQGSICLLGGLPRATKQGMTNTSELSSVVAKIGKRKTALKVTHPPFNR